MTAISLRETPRDRVHLNVEVSRDQAEFLRARADGNYVSASVEVRRLITAAMCAENDRIAA